MLWGCGDQVVAVSSTARTLSLLPARTWSRVNADDHLAWSIAVRRVCRPVGDPRRPSHGSQRTSVSAEKGCVDAITHCYVNFIWPDCTISVTCRLRPRAGSFQQHGSDVVRTLGRVPPACRTPRVATAYARRNANVDLSWSPLMLGRGLAPAIMRHQHVMAYVVEVTGASISSVARLSKASR